MFRINDHIAFIREQAYPVSQAEGCGFDHRFPLLRMRELDEGLALFFKETRLKKITIINGAVYLNFPPGLMPVVTCMGKTLILINYEND